MIDLNEREIDLILHIKKHKFKEFWQKWTGNSGELWFDGMLKHYFLPQVLPIIHKWLENKRCYEMAKRLYK